jgi:hypothetical protein
VTPSIVTHAQIAAILARTRQSAEASSVTSSGYVTPTSGTTNFSALNFSSNVLNAASPSSTPNMATPTGTGTLQIPSGVFADFAKSIRTLNIESDSDNDASGGEKARSTLSNSQGVNLSDVRDAAAAVVTQHADRYADDSDTELQQQQQQRQQQQQQQHDSTDDILVLAEQSLTATADHDGNDGNDDVYKHSDSDSYNRGYELSDANDDTFESESHDANTAALPDSTIQQLQQQQLTGIAAAADNAAQQSTQHRYYDEEQTDSDSDSHSKSADAVTGRISMQYRVASDNDEPDTQHQQQQQQQQFSKRFNEFIESPKQSPQHNTAAVSDGVHDSVHKQSDSTAAASQKVTAAAQQQRIASVTVTQQPTADADARHSVNSSTHTAMAQAIDISHAPVTAVHSSSNAYDNNSSTTHVRSDGSGNAAPQQQQPAMLQSPAQSAHNSTSNHMMVNTGYESPSATPHKSITSDSIVRAVDSPPPPPPPIDDDDMVATDSTQQQRQLQQQQQQQQQRVRLQQQQQLPHSSSSDSSTSSSNSYGQQQQQQQQQHDGYSGVLGIAAASAVTWDVPTKASSFKELQLQLQRLQQVNNTFA